MESSDFVALVKTLREMGAVRVRSGALEVAFAAPEQRIEAPEPIERVISGAELDELALVRRLAEEVP